MIARTIYPRLAGGLQAQLLPIKITPVAYSQHRLMSRIFFTGLPAYPRSVQNLFLPRKGIPQNELPSIYRKSENVSSFIC